jgi:rhomboid protease GluP
MNKYEFHSLDHFERKPTSDRQNYFEARTKQTADNNLIILEPIKKNMKTEMEINLLGYLAHLVLDLAFCCLFN